MQLTGETERKQQFLLWSRKERYILVKIDSVF